MPASLIVIPQTILEISKFLGQLLADEDTYIPACATTDQTSPAPAGLHNQFAPLVKAFSIELLVTYNSEISPCEKTCRAVTG